VAGVATALHPPNDINGQWTAALGAIEGDEPSLTTVVAVQIKVSLINNTESRVPLSWFLFSYFRVETFTRNQRDIEMLKDEIHLLIRFLFYFRNLYFLSLLRLEIF